MTARRLLGTDESPPSSHFGLVSLVDPRRPFSRLAGGFMISSVGDPFSLAISLVLIHQLLDSTYALALAYGTRAVAAILVGGLAGSITDRVDRRRLLIVLDACRFLIIAAMPLVVTRWPLVIFPCLFLLGSAEALAQPARLAGATVLAPPDFEDRANSLLMVSYSVAQAVGFGLAGLAITELARPQDVYWIDSATFLGSLLLTMTLPNVGGGITRLNFRLNGLAQLRRADLRPLLLATGGANLFIGLGAPVFLPMAYLLLPRNGAAGYTWFEISTIVGILIGSLALARLRPRRPAISMAYGIAAFGVAGLVVGAAPDIRVALVGLAATGVANAIYSVLSRTALMQIASEEERGAVMSTRYSIAQTAQIVGFGLGALVATLATPRGAFATVGLGSLVVAAVFLLGYRQRAPVSAEAPVSEESVGS